MLRMLVHLVAHYRIAVCGILMPTTGQWEVHVLAKVPGWYQWLGTGCQAEKAHLFHAPLWHSFHAHEVLRGCQVQQIE